MILLGLSVALAGCTQADTFFDRIVASRLKYRIDFIEIELRDFIRGFVSEKQKIDYVDVFSSIPDPAHTSHLYPGPGSIHIGLSESASIAFKEKFVEVMQIAGEKKVHFPLDVSMRVVLEDGSGFTFSLSMRSKFDSNVLTMEIFKTYTRYSEYKGPVRTVDVSQLKDKEELLKFMIAILRDLNNPSSPDVSKWFADIYPEVRPVFSIKK
jgi:hypothetical protein